MTIALPEIFLTPRILGTHQNYIYDVDMYTNNELNTIVIDEALREGSYTTVQLKLIIYVTRIFCL